jgi:hypothetical protein
MNRLYPKGRQAFLEGLIAWLTDDIRAVLVDTALYTYNAAHEFLSDIPVGARVQTSPSLTGKTSVDGVADADDVSFPSQTRPSVEALVLVKWTGVAATTRLIAYIDSAAGLPMPAQGVAIIHNHIWDNGSNRIFVL